MTEPWNLIDVWPAKNASASLAERRPPASPEAVGRTEERLGFEIPADLCESLLCHDGDDVYLAVLPFGPLYSTERIVEIRTMRMRIWDADDPEQRDAPWWGARWAPFAGRDGDEHFIDAGPGLWHNHLGRAAQDDSATPPAGRAWPPWLHAVAQAMPHHGGRDHVEPAKSPIRFCVKVVD
ncbi:SMI1/KNR4 family protein [Kitasatospora sp. NPDC087271]|uniref:SMI1/KNR4 family protein n=1 Tax=Kitasatospora sp. NPDC087271 TaxID=3364067 RepID=UPI003801E3C9